MDRRSGRSCICGSRASGARRGAAAQGCPKRATRSVLAQGRNSRTDDGRRTQAPPEARTARPGPRQAAPVGRSRSALPSQRGSSRTSRTSRRSLAGSRGDRPLNSARAREAFGPHHPGPARLGERAGVNGASGTHVCGLTVPSALPQRRRRRARHVSWRSRGRPPVFPWGPAPLPCDPASVGPSPLSPAAHTSDAVHTGAAARRRRSTCAGHICTWA